MGAVWPWAEPGSEFASSYEALVIDRLMDYERGYVKTLFLPDWSEGNPYQKLLINGLRSNGVEADLDDFHRRWPRLLRTVLKHGSCDIVHLHWIDSYISWITSSKGTLKQNIKILLCFIDLLLVKIIGKKIIWTVHNIYGHDAGNISLELKLRKLIFRMAGAVIAHSESGKKDIIAEYGITNEGSIEKIHVVEHGDYCGYYPNTVKKNEARYRLGIGGDGKVFLFLGAIRPYKGIEDLVDAFKECNFSGKSKLLIVGKPGNTEIDGKINRLIEGIDNIEFHPKFIDDDEIQLYMNAADVCVFPFKKILTSGSVILAMSFGKAIIVPKQGCLMDLVDEKGAIFFREHRTLKECLKVAEKKELESMGENNLNLIKHYGWDFVASKLINVYKNVSCGKRC